MKDLVHAQKVIYPDLLEVMQKRYMVLNTISLFEPIGRRGLIEQTHLPERYIRNEIELLKEQQLIQTTSKGMFVTKIGQNIIADLYHFNRELLGIAKLEEKLKKLIGIQSVIIVPGNSDSSLFVKQELGKAT